LVQESLARAWQNWDALRNVESARPWLLAICRNEHARILRREQPRQGQDIDDEYLRAPVDCIARETDLRLAIAALPFANREPLLLQVLGGLSCSEIAELLGTTEGAIMTRLTRAAGASQIPRVTILLTTERFVRARSVVAQGGWTAVEVPLPSGGTMAIVAATLAQAEREEHLLSKVFNWRS
jgi:RNA polymerase sigma factor (sigma-70 family)